MVYYQVLRAGMSPLARSARSVDMTGHGGLFKGGVGNCKRRQSRRLQYHHPPLFFPHVPCHGDPTSGASAWRHPPHPTPFFFPHAPSHVVQASGASARRHPPHPTPFFFPHVPSHIDQASGASARRHPPHLTPLFCPHAPRHVVQASEASAWRHPLSPNMDNRQTKSMKRREGCKY
jgi:hypothetical protein